MYLFSLCIFLHINFASLIRMLQGTSPFQMNMSKLNSLESPNVLLSLSLLRGLFVFLIFYNSLTLSFLFYRNILIAYYLWFAGFVFWVNSFLTCNFIKATKQMAILTLYSTALCIELPLFFPNVLWSVYCMYLSAWYRWCLPI